jgi:FkbM family methyltransferase
MKKLPVEYVETKRNYLLFKNDCGVTSAAREGWIYEQFLFDYCKQHLDLSGRTVIDIGANFGYHSLEFADMVAHGHVHSFEPQRLVYYQLCGNVFANGYANVTAHNIALGEKSGQLKMENIDYWSQDTINVGNSHLNAYTQGGYNWVDVRTLDSYNFTDVAMIKIDVQGYEPQVLDGAIMTIQQNRPTIFIEIEAPQLSIYGWQPNDVFSRLDRLGYRYWKLHDADHLVDYVAVAA